jgi:glycosyltransferase involved in cell wall biosynthesis
VTMIGMACPHCGWNLYAPSEMPVKCGRCLNVSNVVAGQLNLSPGHLPQLESIPECNPWDSLHSYAVQHRDDWDATTAERWYLIKWVRTVPKYKPDGATCGCQTHWAELTKEFPPDFSSPEAFERWAFDRHDDVSRLHSGARRITWEQSQRLWRGPRVGFLAATYQAIGGTETFHRTLLPELRHLVRIAGFHATSCQGDTTLLKIPILDRKSLIEQSDVIVTWGIDDLRDCAGKRVISVHHADTNSGWSDRLQLQPEITDIVCVNPAVPDKLSTMTNIPTHYIPNGVKPTTPSGRDVREEFQLGDRKIVLWPHRWSHEKQPELAQQVAEYLPSDFVLVMTADGQSKGNVRFVGKQANIADWLRVCHCVLSLATFEGFGYSVAEAMIAGVPVVSYARGICNSGNSTIIPANATAAEIAKLCCEASTISSDSFPVDEWVEEWVGLIHVK